MFTKADPVLITEMAIWPDYRPEGRPDTGEGGAGKVEVLLPSPPVVAGLAPFFRLNPEAAWQSHQALRTYRVAYEQAEEFPYPLRLRPARHVGLPTFLNGYLDAESVPDISEDPATVARDWLLQNVRSHALFGTNPDLVDHQLKTGRVAQTARHNNEAAPSVHVSFQQWHRPWDDEQGRPVFAGNVVVALTAEDPRASATSSYFPVPEEMAFTPKIEEEEAIQVAQWALAGYLSGREAIGLYWLILDRQLEAPLETWGPMGTQIVQKQIHALAQFERNGQPAFPNLKDLVANDTVPAELEALHSLLNQARERWSEMAVGTWNAQIAPYEGKKQFILPFAGNYYLAYRVELLSGNGDGAWRVFVDAETGQVLGRPHSLALHTPLEYFATTADTLAGSLDILAAGAGADLDGRLSEFARLELDGSLGNHAISLAAIEDGAWPPPGLDLPAGVPLEAVNAGKHAVATYDHFLAMGVDPAELQSYTRPNGNVQQPPLAISVGMTAPDLDTHFLEAETQHPKPVVLQTDDGSGLDTAGGNPVFAPTLDPEVIYHEITHALMWLLNEKPFVNENDDVPFGRALLEGYANYFARSLAARTDDASDLWARAAYREGAWGERWSLERLDREPGADLLPAPNLYPSMQTEGFPVYDVGMVLARALWQVRKIVGPDVADQLAIRAYRSALGWTTSFEVVAEAVIDQARLDPAVGDFAFEAIIDAFARRGILAEQGVQALARAGNGDLFAGNDAGLHVSEDGGQTWGTVPLGDEAAAQGVVAIATEGNEVIVATEGAVYRRDDGGDWAPMGDWPVFHRPLYLLVADGIPFVGTGHGVLHFDGIGWQQWSPDETLDALVLGLADMVVPDPPSADVRNRYAVIVAGVKFRQEGFGWEQREAFPAPPATAIAARGPTVYVGTLHDGIWRQEADGYDENEGTIMTAWDDGTRWDQFVAPAGLDNSSVLCLAVDGARLLAGTTSGLYDIDADGLATQIHGGWPSGAMITAVLPVGAELLAGTAAHGLWRQPSPAAPWQPVM